MIVHYASQPIDRVAARISALPDLAAFSTRFEVTDDGIGSGNHEGGDAVAEVVPGSGRRGYAVVAGRDLSPRGAEVLVEARWRSRGAYSSAAAFYVDGLGPQRVVGFTEAPDNVGYPLAKPRFYVSRAAIDARFARDANPKTNLAYIWLRDPAT